MCGLKFTFLGLALLATSITAENVTATQQCILNDEHIKELSQNILQYYDNMFISKMENNDSYVASFDDFNRMYYDLYSYSVATCAKVPNVTIPNTVSVHLDMVKFFVDNKNFKEIAGKMSCIQNSKTKDALKTCNKPDLPELSNEDAPLGLIRRSLLTFDSYECDHIRSSQNCTTKIIETDCDPEILYITNTLFDMALKHCNDTAAVKLNSSPYITPFTHFFFFIIAFTLFK